jgi:hypothetical protein
MGQESYLQKSLMRESSSIKAKIFVQDAMFHRENGVGIQVINLPGEPWLGAGPTSSRIQVVDFDDSTGETHPPVGVLASGTGFDVGGGQPESNYKFHQVNVWAIMKRVLDHLESPNLVAVSLGRFRKVGYRSDSTLVWQRTPFTIAIQAPSIFTTSKITTTTPFTRACLTTLWLTNWDTPCSTDSSRSTTESTLPMSLGFTSISAMP